MSESPKPRFVYPLRVAYHETDAMAVVHHSNHVKYFEEARVEWLRDRGIMSIHQPYGPYVFAVVKLETRYFKPARFDDALEVWVQSRLEGARIVFQYALWCERLGEVIADGRTELVPANQELRPVRLPPSVREVFAREAWLESWPPPRD